MFRNILIYQRVILLLWLGLSAGFAQADKVYVSNRGSNSVSVIDTNSNSVVATIPVKQSPQHMVANSLGTRIYGSTGDNISIIDTSSNNRVVPK